MKNREKIRKIKEIYENLNEIQEEIKKKSMKNSRKIKEKSSKIAAFQKFFNRKKYFTISFKEIEFVSRTLFAISKGFKFLLGKLVLLFELSSSCWKSSKTMMLFCL